MSEWFGWLQQKALADPFAKRYAQAAQLVLTLLALLVFLVLVFAVVYYNVAYDPSAEPPPESTDRAWGNFAAEIAIALVAVAWSQFSRN